MKTTQQILTARAHEIIDTLGLGDWSLLARLEELSHVYLAIGPTVLSKKGELQEFELVDARDFTNATRAVGANEPAVIPSAPNHPNDIIEKADQPRVVPTPTENELMGARYQGRAVAEAAKKLHG